MVLQKEASAASSVMTTHRNADGESAKEEVPQKQQEKESESRGWRERTERVEVLTEREKKIYQFFSEKKGGIRSGLKEIAQVFPDLTDRTVRNDLRALCIKKLVVRSDGHGQASFYKLGNVIAEA